MEDAACPLREPCSLTLVISVGCSPSPSGGCFTASHEQEYEHGHNRAEEQGTSTDTTVHEHGQGRGAAERARAPGTPARVKARGGRAPPESDDGSPGDARATGGIAQGGDVGAGGRRHSCCSRWWTAAQVVGESHSWAGPVPGGARATSGIVQGGDSGAGGSAAQVGDDVGGQGIAQLGGACPWRCAGDAWRKMETGIYLQQICNC